VQISLSADPETGSASHLNSNISRGICFQAGLIVKLKLGGLQMNRFTKANFVILFVFSFFLVSTLSCGKDRGVNSVPPSPYVKASDWIASVDWNQATTVELLMIETSPTEMSFSPDSLAFVAGKPYILRIKSPSTNAAKHYFATEGPTDFFKAVATRKIQTSDAEYKAPYFLAVELLIGGELDIYFVPVLAGTYNFLCTIPNHKDYGMFGKIVITGGAGYQLDLQVDASFNPALLTDPRTSGSHSVWSTKVTVPVQMVEGGATPYSYNPSDLYLKKDSAYVITISNPSSNAEKHYYTAAEFCRTVVTRKFEDSDAEVKAPYFKAIELLIGGTAKEYVVPTVADTFYVHCTIPGHTENGMEGSIIVSP